MRSRHSVAGVALIGVALILVSAGPVLAASFDFETVPSGFYAGSLSVSDGGLTLTVTPEGFPNGFVQVDRSDSTILGDRSIIGTRFNPQQINGFAPMRFAFSAPILAITFAFGDSGGDDDSPFLIRAFDAGDVLLTSATGAYPADFGMGMTQSLSTPTGASYFILDSTPTLNPHSLWWEVQDVTPVPEPATLTSFGTGLLAAWFARRKRK